MVHHDLSLVQAHFDRVLILAGRVVAAGTVAEAFTDAAIATAFGGLPGRAA
jgi:ABC-type Mn2+/Zn2+ transport system ATPase subunit